MSAIRLILFVFCLLTSFYVQSQTQFKAVTYNVNSTPLKKNKKNISKIQNTISYYDADIILIQEAFSKQSSYLKTVENYPYFNQKEMKKKMKLLGSGLITISKHPIVIESYKYFSKSNFMGKFKSRGILRTQIRHPVYGKIDIYNTQLSKSKKEKVKWAEVTELVGFIKQNSKNMPFILGGDFNIEENTDYYQYLLNSLGINDTHKNNETNSGDTYVKKKKSKRIDYIFYRNHLYEDYPFQHINNELIYTGAHDENQYSDHFGVLSEFGLL